MVIVEQPDLVPLCPYCDKALDEVAAVTPKTGGSTTFSFGVRTVYACPSCHKALAISHRKGFWQG